VGAASPADGWPARTSIGSADATRPRPPAAGRRLRAATADRSSGGNPPSGSTICSRSPPGAAASPETTNRTPATWSMAHSAVSVGGGGGGRGAAGRAGGVHATCAGRAGGRAGGGRGARGAGGAAAVALVRRTAGPAGSSARGHHVVADPKLAVRLEIGGRPQVAEGVIAGSPSPATRRRRTPASPPPAQRLPRWGVGSAAPVEAPRSDVADSPDNRTRAIWDPPGMSRAATRAGDRCARRGGRCGCGGRGSSGRSGP
jgi:hypothetical protein